MKVNFSRLEIARASGLSSSLLLLYWIPTHRGQEVDPC